MCIILFSTDPSETNQLRRGQVVFERFYKPFINSSLSSSCGQLKGKHFYENNCIINLTVNNLRLWNKLEKLKICSYFSWDSDYFYRSSVYYLYVLIAFRVYNHSRHSSTLGVHRFQASLFCTVPHNSNGSSVCNIVHVNTAMCRIFMCHSYFCIIETLWFTLF